MSSLFDSEVYQRRRATPCTRIDIEALLKRIALHQDDGEGHQLVDVTLTVHYRPDVASRFWWSLQWKAEDGEERILWAQELDLLLWRAATSEARTAQRLELQKAAKA